MEHVTTTNAKSDDAAIDSFIQSMEAAGPSLTFEEAEHIEKFWERDGVARRCMLAILLKSPAEIAEAVLTDREFAKAVAQVADRAENINTYRAITDLLDRSVKVAIYALAGREDMQDIIAEAAAEGEAGAQQ